MTEKRKFTSVKMEATTVILLLLIGVIAGVLSGFAGIGGGVVIVPALMLFLGLTQHQAQGTSLFVLMMPVVTLAVWNYWKEGNVNWKFGLIIASAFLIGSYAGSRLSLSLSPAMVKIVFGILMASIAFKMIVSGYTTLTNES